MDLPLIRRVGLTLALGLALGGCTTATWQRLLYDAGDNYACEQAGAHLHYAKARAAQCADDRAPDRTRYEDYKAARDQVISPQP